MALSDVLRGWMSGDGESSDQESAPGPTAESADTVVYECRDCGTTVSPETTVCPNCDSEAIAEYPIE